MKTTLASLFALSLLASAAAAGDARFSFLGTVATTSNPDGAYAGVEVGDPVVLACEVFTTSPAPTVVNAGH